MSVIIPPFNRSFHRFCIHSICLSSFRHFCTCLSSIPPFLHCTDRLCPFNWPIQLPHVIPPFCIHSICLSSFRHSIGHSAIFAHVCIDSCHSAIFAHHSICLSSFRHFYIVRIGYAHSIDLYRMSFRRFCICQQLIQVIPPFLHMSVSIAVIPPVVPFPRGGCVSGMG